MAAARLLSENGLAASVAVAASLAPAPREDLLALLSRMPLAVTLESHYTNGGLGSLVSEIVAEEGLDCRVLRLGISRSPQGLAGSSASLLEQHGLDAASVARVASRAPRDRLMSPEPRD